MQFKFIAFVLVALPFISAIPTVRNSEARADCTLITTMIGAHKNVKMEAYKCSSSPTRRVLSSLTKRDRNVCGNTCNTYQAKQSNTFTPADCTVIADALTYESQNSGNTFTVPPMNPENPNSLTLSYGTCKSTFVNQDAQDLTYCKDDLSSLTTWLGVQDSDTAGTGGLCYAPDETWFVQVYN